MGGWDRRSVGLRLAAGLAGAVLALGPRPAGAAEPRIVSLGGAVTEILYDLGAGDEVAAVDTTSIHPPEALRTKPSVGYLRQLSAEGVLAARPTLVLAVEGAGPPDALKLVREAGVPLATIPEDHSAEGVTARILAVARAAGREEAGRRLASGVEAGFRDLARLRARVGRPARALFILSLQNGRTMVGGRNTTADGMLALSGAANAAEGVDGFKPMTDEAILAAQPEFVVMLALGPGGAPPADLFERTALAQTPAGRERRLVVMDGLQLLGFGPRTPAAARELLLSFHPALKAE